MSKLKEIIIEIFKEPSKIKEYQKWRSKLYEIYSLWTKLIDKIRSTIKRLEYYTENQKLLEHYENILNLIMPLEMLHVRGINLDNLILKMVETDDKEKRKEILEKILSKTANLTNKYEVSKCKKKKKKRKKSRRKSAGDMLDGLVDQFINELFNIIQLTTTAKLYKIKVAFEDGETVEKLIREINNYLNVLSESIEQVLNSELINYMTSTEIKWLNKFLEVLREKIKMNVEVLVS